MEALWFELVPGQRYGCEAVIEVSRCDIHHSVTRLLLFDCLQGDTRQVRWPTRGEIEQFFDSDGRRLHGSHDDLDRPTPWSKIGTSGEARQISSFFVESGIHQ
jgi:hypothetical protein